MTQFFEVVAWVGAFTAFLLASQAIANPEIKKVLAYSTGSQIGYMMMGIGIAGLSTNFVDGYTAGFFQLISHAMFKAALFMGAGALLHVVGSRFMTDMGGMRKYMRKTYVFMFLAALSLAAAPLITLGFWSKDAIFAAVLGSGYVHSLPLFIMAFVVAIMTAFYTFRMIGMSFFGKKSPHLEEQEKAGHPLHEVRPIVWVPFGILAVATIAIGVIGFAFGGQLQHIFAGYLANYFGITPQKQLQLLQNPATTTQLVKPQIQSKLFLGLNPSAAAASFGAFAIGGFLGYMFYIARKIDPQIISKNIVTRGIWKFLYDRWYLNSAIYWGAVIGPVAIYRMIWRYFEFTVMDGISHAFEFSMASFSRVIKAGQTGITQTYLFVFGAGIMIIIMLLLL
jgi:NADH-quinone oxidoreductase subunit L